MDSLKKKFMSSPLAKRKNYNTPTPSSLSILSPTMPVLNVAHTSDQPPLVYFGIPLKQITQREGTKVPILVTKICHHIYKHGEFNSFNNVIKLVWVQYQIQSSDLSISVACFVNPFNMGNCCCNICGFIFKSM